MSARLLLEIAVPLVASDEEEYHQPLVFLNVTLVNLIQLENALSPIEVTPSGISILVKLLHNENALLPI